MFDLSNCRFAFLDLETTGLSPWFGDRICEVGIVLAEGKRIKATYQQLVNPGCPLSPAAASTNRLTDVELQEAPPFADLAKDVEAWLADAVVVAHNAQFDLQFLDSVSAAIGRLPTTRPASKISRSARGCPFLTGARTPGSGLSR